MDFFNKESPLKTFITFAYLIEFSHVCYMKFIADNMLGKLAKYLRMAGYDTIYPPRRNSDNQLELDSPDRILLTRNSRYIRQHNPPQYLLIKPNHFREQLAFVIKELDLEINPERFFYRCLKCNEPVISVSKKEVQDIVPEKSWKSYNTFFRCAVCGKIYWQGSHTRRMLSTLKNILSEC